MELDQPAYDVPEAAAASKISPAYLYELLKAGKGPRAKKLGRRTLILREDLIAWLHAQQDYPKAA